VEGEHRAPEGRRAAEEAAVARRVHHLRVAVVEVQGKLPNR
jgi:hypothetical protein